MSATTRSAIVSRKVKFDWENAPLHWLRDDRMNVPPSPAEVRCREATEELYRQFAAPTPSVIEGCPCCIETRGVDILLSTPLRTLSGQALWRYVSGAFLTIGSTRDFRYFLPRIFEIALLDPRNSNSAEIVLGKLRRAAWQQWPPGERDANCKLRRAAWQQWPPGE
eukprot:gene46710-63278_t